MATICDAAIGYGVPPLRPTFSLCWPASGPELGTTSSPRWPGCGL